MSRINIGVTIGLHQEDESLWVNGIKQNALFLVKLLRQLDHKYNAFLVNTTDIPISDKLPWDRELFPTHSFAEVWDGIDVLIMLGGGVGGLDLDNLKKKGVKRIMYYCGAEYWRMVEAICYKKAFKIPPYYYRDYDAVWIIPQNANSNLHFLHQVTRSRPQVVPFIWDPVFLTEMADKLVAKGKYVSRPGPKRISCFEPNIQFLKTFIYPLMIAEQAYVERPELVSRVAITCSDGFREDVDFIALANHFSLAKEPGKCVFTERHVTPWFLAEHTDVVVSHQIENPLNYIYLEACWQGYPLIHNAHLCKELGYYYEGFDVDQGKEQLLKALIGHDAHYQYYIEDQRRLIRPYLTSNPRLVKQYEDMIDGLLAGRPV